VAGVALKLGVPLPRLLAANGWTHAPDLHSGQILRIPPPASRADKGGATDAQFAAAEAAAAPAPVPPGPAAEADKAPSSAPVPREPVSERQAGSAALLPAAAPTGSADATDYAVAADGTVLVQADETLGHLADWSGVSPDRLRSLNRLHKGAMVSIGRRVKLDAAHTDRERFAARRREFHRKLQEAFFAGHRIAGTETYAFKRGESVWTVVQQHSDLPLWLVTQYNPDLDFNGVREGMKITLPVVEPINRQ